MDFGTQLKSYRKKAKFTQQELANESGVSRTYLSDVENNRYKPSVEMVKKLSYSLINKLSTQDNDQSEIFSTLMSSAGYDNTSINKKIYDSVEDFRYSIIKQLYEKNLLESGMKENNKDLYRHIGGTEFINEVYEQVAKENLGYEDRDKIVKTFKSMYNRRLFSHLTKKSSEKEKLETAENTVNLNLALEYFERKSKIDIALKENHEHNANNKNHLIPFDPAKFDRVPKIILDDKPLNDDEIKKVAESIEEIRSNRK